MAIKDAIAQDAGVLAFENESRFNYKADINSVIFSQNSPYQGLADYDYFSDFKLDFDKKCFVWTRGEEMPFDLVESKSEKSLLCGLPRIPRRLPTKELNEFLAEFSEIINDVFPGCEVYLTGDYLDGMPDWRSSVDFIVKTNRDFALDIIPGRLSIFLEELCCEGYGWYPTLQALEKGYKNNPKHVDAVQKLKTARRIR